MAACNLAPKKHTCTPRHGSARVSKPRRTSFAGSSRPRSASYSNDSTRMFQSEFSARNSRPSMQTLERSQPRSARAKADHHLCYPSPVGSINGTLEGISSAPVSTRSSHRMNQSHWVPLDEDFEDPATIGIFPRCECDHRPHYNAVHYANRPDFYEEFPEEIDIDRSQSSEENENDNQFMSNHGPEQHMSEEHLRRKASSARSCHISVHDGSQTSSRRQSFHLSDESDDRWCCDTQDDRKTVLHLAAENGHETVVKTLLQQKNLNVCAKDIKGSTALHCAARQGHHSIVKILIEANADMNVRDIKGWTPLQEAANGGHDSIVRFLVDQGAFVC